jgi:hypothetical protein
MSRGMVVGRGVLTAPCPVRWLADGAVRTPRPTFALVAGPAKSLVARPYEFRVGNYSDFEFVSNFGFRISNFPFLSVVNRPLSTVDHPAITDR